MSEPTLWKAAQQSLNVLEAIWINDSGKSMICQTIIDLRTALTQVDEPVLVVEKEPDYWTGGHFHEGTCPHINLSKVRGLPIGTKLYTNPQQEPTAQSDLGSIEQYRMQMAGISTAAIGYWKEGDSIHPDYDTVVLRDVAKLYAHYAAATKRADLQRHDGNYQSGYVDGREAGIEIGKREAQPDPLEPVAWAHPIEWHKNIRAQSEQVVKITRNRQAEYGYTIPLYAAPKPAPVAQKYRTLLEQYVPVLQPDPLVWECKAGGLRSLTQRHYAVQSDKVKCHFTKIPSPQPTSVAQDLITALQAAVECLEDCQGSKQRERYPLTLSDAREAIAKVKTALTITPLMEQQMYADWCPYKGSTDPRVVWAAAMDAVNGLLLGAGQRSESPEQRDAVLLQVIQRLNANPYNMTKAECISEVFALRASKTGE